MRVSANEEVNGRAPQFSVNGGCVPGWSSCDVRDPDPYPLQREPQVLREGPAYALVVNIPVNRPERPLASQFRSNGH